MTKKTSSILLVIAVIIAAAVITGIILYPVISDRMTEAEETAKETQDTSTETEEAATETEKSTDGTTGDTVQYNGNNDIYSDTNETTASETEKAPVKAPDFTVYDKDGNPLSLSSVLTEKKKPVLLNFWATWCPPCVGELPHFEAMYKEYSDRVEFIMINLTDGYDETVGKVNSFISKNSYTFPVYFDTELSAVIAYRISSIPLTVLIDTDGYIADSRVGAMNEETLRGYLDSLLGEKAKEGE